MTELEAVAFAMTHIWVRDAERDRAHEACKTLYTMLLKTGGYSKEELLERVHAERIGE